MKNLLNRDADKGVYAPIIEEAVATMHKTKYT
jgi:hypothetical protein